MSTTLSYKIVGAILLVGLLGLFNFVLSTLSLQQFINCISGFPTVALLVPMAFFSLVRHNCLCSPVCVSYCGEMCFPLSHRQDNGNFSVSSPSYLLARQTTSKPLACRTLDLLFRCQNIYCGFNTQIFKCDYIFILYLICYGFSEVLGTF